MGNNGKWAVLGRSSPLTAALAVALVLLSAGQGGADPKPRTLGTLPIARPVTETGSINQASLQDPSDNTTSDEPAMSATALAPAAAPAPGATAVTGIRLGDRGAETRFVVELGGADAVKYHIFTLADPYRVVVDLPNMPSRLPENTALKGRGLISDYRYGQFQNNTFRIVIDTTGPVSVSRDFILDPQGGFGRRVVLDLAATDRATFLASVGLPAADKAAAQAEAQPAAIPVVPPTPPAAHDRRRVVVIDPGHGGVDPGTHGRSSGVVEKDVVLAFGRALAKRLRDTGRYDVYMTRDKDIFIPLRERVQIARAHKADLFISIHADSISKPDVSGMSVYTLSETASDKEAAALARKENLSDAIAGIDFKGESPEVTGILIDLAQRETKNYSARFAKSVVDYARHSTTLLEPTHRFAGFVVLKAPDVPSVLVELGFLTNGGDEKRLTSAKWRNSVTGSFVKAVDRYFGDRLAEGPN
ncbi:MAG: N-acetylmuramoyl-L-alanine amidase [Parvibaculum sp.]|uniref:N-acetylmuramoyl-L-alanine amidase n=1 Tax=Parvibaculum sp. TaxID=2024848 RepID=UPI00283E7F4D|nr:N-acetylmuramoyl-L-alanine amidase [Parvibaculum sp.]MDR3498086.1 N-acetylmuramoyl-L-alanine amidase [Parvibaculum sp.]